MVAAHCGKARAPVKGVRRAAARAEEEEEVEGEGEEEVEGEVEVLPVWARAHAARGA